jgi:mxaJ protein
MAGEVDVAIVWGPLAGWFAKGARVPLTLAALPENDAVSELPFAFDISFGVRRTERGLRDELDTVLARKTREIAAILDEYGVPRGEVAP